MINSLEEAIKHCEEVAERQETNANSFENGDDFDKSLVENCLECAEEHRQLSEWLKKLQAYEEAEEEIKRKMRSGQWSDAVAYGMSKAIVIMKKCRFAHNCKEVNADEDSD